MSKWNELKARKLTLAQIEKVNREVAAELLRMDLREFALNGGALTERIRHRGSVRPKVRMSKSRGG